jgi:O-antigen ligase
LAYFHAIEGPIYYLFLRHVGFKIGSTDVSFAPSTGSLALLGLVCFEDNLPRFWFPILICSFDTIAGEMRADWLGLGMAIAIWAIATGRIKRVLAMAGILTALLTIGFITDVRMPGLPGRGGEISARDTVGRALSGIDPALARELSPGSTIYAGTIAWRENWWKAIRQEVFKSPVTAIFGFGYGYPINQLVPALRNSDIRSPHSVFYFTLANSGLVGFALFVMLQLQLLRLLWKTFRQTGQIFGFLCAIFAIENSMFGNFFEAPQRAVPTYILIGMCIGPLFLVSQEQSVGNRERRERKTPMPLPGDLPIDWPTTSEPALY